MTNPLLIVFSGAQGCGKDTAIEYLEKFYTLERAECKETLHSATMELFNVPEDVYWDIYNNRELKKKPFDYLAITKKEAFKLGIVLESATLMSGANTRVTQNGKVALNIREAMVYTSECVMKPMFGNDVFGVRRAQKLTNGVYVDGSYGFKEEAQPAIDKLGQDNILAIRITGRSDGNIDSRTPIPDGLFDNTVDIHNGEDVSLETFQQRVLNVVEDFLGERGVFMHNHHYEGLRAKHSPF